eukprot:6202352-Pleurochrysis_carterae.AAC.5
MAVEKLDIPERARQRVRVLEKLDVIQVDAPVNRSALHRDACREAIANCETVKVDRLAAWTNNRVVEPRVGKERDVNACGNAGKWPTEVARLLQK